jgi:hypothetical protein
MAELDPLAFSIFSGEIQLETALLVPPQSSFPLALILVRRSRTCGDE